MSASDERIQQIAQRAAEATEGPWAVDPEAELHDAPVLTPSGNALCISPDDGVRGGHDLYDAQFIAHAREDVPWLIGQLRDARAAYSTVCDYAETTDALTAQLRDARAEVERLESAGGYQAMQAVSARVERDELGAMADRLLAKSHAERDELRAKLAAVRALCDDYRANCDPTSTQARVAEIFHAALSSEDL